MRRSLSLVLPIRNVQSTLKSTVEFLLESLSDHVQRFEAILIDDGSTDDTPEVLFEVAERYPQIKALYHDTPRGWRRSVQHGLERASGEMLLIREENCRLSIDMASRLLAAAEHYPLVLGTIRPIRWPHRWIGWRQSETGGGFRLIVPALLEAHGHAVDELPLLATAKVKELAAWRAIPVADCPDEFHQRIEEGRYYRRSDAHESLASGLLGVEYRPNFLRQVREFALGE